MENKIIDMKIKEKTKNDVVMENFIESIIDIEINNKHYSTPYKTLIKEAVKERD